MKTSGMMRKPRNNRPVNAGPCIRSRYLGEPRLVFADGREDVDPKLGISRFGLKKAKSMQEAPLTQKVRLPP